MSDEIISSIDYFIADLLKRVEANNYNDLKIKVYRNQPPKKLDVRLDHKMYRNTRIKIRNIKVDENLHCTFKSDVDVCFFGVKWVDLTELQTTALEHFVKEISKSLIKTYFLSK